MILLQLPMRDLLFAQRTCLWFQSVIENSPHLQRALLFKPAYVLTEGEAGELMKFPGSEYRVPSEPRKYRWCTADWEDDGLRIYPNSLFDCLGIHPKRQPSERLDGLLAYPNASWRRMLVCQPAVPFVRMRWKSISGTTSLWGYDDVGIHTSYCRDVEEEGGVRLGTLRDHCVKLWCNGDCTWRWSPNWIFWWPWEESKTLAELTKSVPWKRT